MEREKNVWKLMYWLIMDELKQTDWKDILAFVISLVLSAVFYMLFFR